MEKAIEQFIKETNDRLAALEIVHTRYRGPKGEPGDKGEQGPAGKDGKDGKDSNETEIVFAMRIAFREELNAFRDEMYRIRSDFSRDIAEGLDRVREICDAEVEAFCAMRDKAVAELATSRATEGTAQQI